RSIRDWSSDVCSSDLLDIAIAANTHAAHQVTHLAEQSELQHEMVLRLFRGYFAEGLDVGDHEVLGDLAAEVGLDRDRTLEALERSEERRVGKGCRARS